MEEKERYGYGVCGINSFYFDNETHITIDVLKTLNQQYKENQELKQELNRYKGTKLGDFAEEIRQLKQQLEESETQLKEEIEEKNGVRRALSACNRQNDEFADMIKKLVNEKEEIKQQLAISEKALELACEEIIGSCEYCSYNTMPECPIEADCLDEKINYFKAKAKEMLENE